MTQRMVMWTLAEHLLPLEHSAAAIEVFHISQGNEQWSAPICTHKNA